MLAYGYEWSSEGQLPETLREVNLDCSREELDQLIEFLQSVREEAEGVKLDSLSSLSAMSGGKEYKIAENAQVLLRDSTSSQGYYLTDLSQVNAEDYQLTGWYDNLGYSAGGRIRIIVAVPK